ncbi:MAG: cation transporter [Spirochaetes bacterium]|nr:cation transporter [Spirochaetota bacterium]
MPHDHVHNAQKRISLAFFLNFGFALFEIVGGVFTNSVAILSDAFHDLGDSVALVIAWFFERYSKRSADEKYSFGYRRFSLLGAVINGLIIVGGSVFVLTRALPRLLSPEPTRSAWMILFAAVGIVVNGIAVLRLRKGESYNEKIVFWHLFEDVLGWAVVLIVSVVLVFGEYYILDPILSILITIYILFNVARVIRKTVSVLLQSVPGGFDIGSIERDIMKIDGVRSVHHTHIWSLDGIHNVLSTHVVVKDRCSRDEVIGIKQAVRDLFSEKRITHLTIETEYECEECGMKKT